MVGLQLFSPFIQTESTEERRLPCPSVEEFQNDLRSLGWLEGDFEEVEDLRETANLHCSDSAMEDPQPVPEEGQAKTKQSANENVGAVLVDRSGTAAEPVSLNRGVADRRSTPRFAQASEPSAQNEPGRDPRAPLSQQQLDVLESALAFVGPQYRPSRDAYSTLAKRTGLSSERVEAWFEEKRRTAMEEGKVSDRCSYQLEMKVRLQMINSFFILFVL